MIDFRRSPYQRIDNAPQNPLGKRSVSKRHAPESSSSFPSPLMIRPTGSTLAFVLAAITGVIFAFIASYSNAEEENHNNTPQSHQQLAENQYATALWTAISAAEVNHGEMAAFANQQLYQATYCLMLTHPDPMTTLVELTQQITFQPQAQTLLAHFESIKSTFDIERVRNDHPCNHAQFPADALLAGNF